MTPCTTTDLDWHSTNPDEATACIALCATCPERAPCAELCDEVERLRDSLDRVWRLAAHLHDDPALGTLGPVVHALISEAMRPKPTATQTHSAHTTRQENNE